MYKSFAVGDSGGVVNGKLDPGEAADIALVLRNAGSAAGPMTGRLASKSPFLAVLDEAGVFPSVGRGETTSNPGDRFRVRVRTDAPVELPAYCDLRLSGPGYDDTIPVPVIIGDSMNLPAGPDPHGYGIFDYTDSCYRQMPEYDWFELRGAGTRLDLGGDETRAVALPEVFGTWRYYGRDRDSISICSNGWIAAGRTDRVDFVNVPLPYPNSPPNILAVMWDDLDPTLFGSIWYFHDSARHRFIIEYDSVPYFGHADDWEMVQVQVYDRTVPTPTGDNAIVVQFRTANDFSLATVGMQNEDGTAGLCHTANDWYPRVSAPLKPGTAIRFETMGLTGREELLPSRAGSRSTLSVAPNPFRNRTYVYYSTMTAGEISLDVFDASGRYVCGSVLRATAGSGTYCWQPRNFVSGIYFVRLKMPERGAMARVLLLD